MRSKRNIATWMGLVLGTVMALALNATFAHASDDGASVREEFHQTYPLSASGRVSLENINGAAQISVWDQNQVKVDAIKRADDEEGLKNMEIRVQPHADSISIETHYHSNHNNWGGNHYSSVDYTITVPRNAKLDEIKLINGSLNVTGVLGEVRASCINGKLTAQGLGNEARLSTVNGPLEATFERLPASQIELQSVNGPIHLTLPSDAKASLEATTVHGHIDNEFGLHTNNHFVGHDMRGQLGGGGTHIRLNNVNGPIEIRHANDGRTVSPAKSDSKGEDDDEI
jgi:DUF4097 and DUF4098 domain-containing protein YvlB